MLPHGLVAELRFEEVDAGGFARARCVVVAMAVVGVQVGRGRLGHGATEVCVCVCIVGARRSGMCGNRAWPAQTMIRDLSGSVGAVRCGRDRRGW